MRLYKNTYCNDDADCETLWFSSKAAADKAWVHARRTGEVADGIILPVVDGFTSTRSEAVDVPTKKADLIAFLNRDNIS